MTDQSIIFTGESVRAILEGRKTQTRRLSNRYKVGEVRYVKETWCSAYRKGCAGTIFKADGVFVLGKRHHLKGPHFDALGNFDIKWRSPLYLPKWASRLQILVTAVREEKLHKISIDDIVKEGIDLEENEDFDLAEHALIGGSPIHGGIPERYAFFCAWDRINGKRAPSKTNPTVTVVTFEVEENG